MGDYMKYADLHVHSCLSDGTMTPEEIIQEAEEKGIKCISITDHDTISSQYVTKIYNGNLMIIPGIEFSTEYNDLELHILGYFIDIENKALKDAVKQLNKNRLKRVEEILNKLKAFEINITIDELAISENLTVGRSHIANAMVKKGYFDNYKTAFTAYLVKGKPAFVNGVKISYKEILKLIINAGGVPVLAHPGQIYQKREIENIVRELKCYGLKGIEVYHPSHSTCEINSFYNLAVKYKLCITGGSDYHGRQSLHDTGLGSYGVNDILLNKLINIKQR
ncbi:MAG: PHP domain-containing protein [Clostridium sp.]